MKTIYTYFIIILLTFSIISSSYAQWTNDNLNGDTYRKGPVGIGTVDPNSELHVFESSSAARLTIERGNGGTGHITAGSTGDFRLETPNHDRMIQLENHSGNIYFNSTNGTADNADMSIERSNGYVGIGTSDPQQTSHIVSQNATVQTRLERTGSNTGITEIGTDSDGLHFWIGGYNGLGNEEFMITDDGKVAIGIGNPSSKLTVDGKITSEEVKVENIDGADFVFKKGYNLRSLSETEAFINKNKHLPEIPSAKEMQQNGVQLGQMNIKLLQKVEELTLHLIEKHKADQKQQKRINNLEEENQQLKKEVHQLKQAVKEIRKQVDYQ